MDATISRNKFSNGTTKYTVVKWDNFSNPIEVFSTKKKNDAYEKFSQFFRETYNK